MTWRKECETELEDAVAIYATALSLINKTILAFGNCEKCFGKGYSTAAEIDRRIIYCTCVRGAQLERLMNGADV